MNKAELVRMEMLAEALTQFVENSEDTEDEMSARELETLAAAREMLEEVETSLFGFLASA